MPVLVTTSGTLAATGGGAEDTLASIAAEGVYQLVVSTRNMVDGDAATLKIYGKVTSGDVEELVYTASFAHAQAARIKVSLPVPTPHYLRATLTQSAGTARQFPWAVYRL